jgi:hypothetical protein
MDYSKEYIVMCKKAESYLLRFDMDIINNEFLDCGLENGDLLWNPTIKDFCIFNRCDHEEFGELISDNFDANQFWLPRVDQLLELIQEGRTKGYPTDYIPFTGNYLNWIINLLPTCSQYPLFGSTAEQVFLSIFMAVIQNKKWDKNISDWKEITFED